MGRLLILNGNLFISANVFSIESEIYGIVNFIYREPIRINRWRCYFKFCIACFKDCHI